MREVKAGGKGASRVLPTMQSADSGRHRLPVSRPSSQVRTYQTPRPAGAGPSDEKG